MLLPAQGIASLCTHVNGKVIQDKENFTGKTGGESSPLVVLVIRPTDVDTTGVSRD